MRLANDERHLAPPESRTGEPAPPETGATGRHPAAVAPANTSPAMHSWFRSHRRPAPGSGPFLGPATSSAMSAA
jgi:hypothetical protein